MHWVNWRVEFHHVFVESLFPKESTGRPTKIVLQKKRKKDFFISSFHT